ncbi:MAG: hypothetical protein QM490_05870 [Candidatus Gracilibacteria bacterium]
MESKTFDVSSPVPNWPKPEFLKIKKFGIYCGSVTQAIMDGLKRNGEQKILSKFERNREKIKPKELSTIIVAYSEQVDLILMRSGF